jgi:hypothetical protein
LLVFQRQRVITGIVTPADLNKAPARTFFYNLIAELEMVIASLVEDCFKNRQYEISRLLSSERKQDIEDAVTEMVETDREIEIIHLLYLSDLVKILRKEESLRKSLDFESSSQVKNELGSLVDLRNDLVHPVRLILGEKRDVAKLYEQIQTAFEVLHRAFVS